MKVVADSHALVWYMAGSDRLSPHAAEVLRSAEESDGIVISVGTFVDLWYVSQTTKAVSADDLAGLRRKIDGGSTVTVQPINSRVTDAFTAIPRATLRDPWDRFIVATARTLELPLVTRDRAIQKAGVVETIW